MAIAAVLTVAPCPAEDALKYLNKAASAYSRIRSLQVDAVSQTARKGDDLSAASKIPVTLFFVSPDKIRVETRAPGETLQLLLVFDGKVLTEYRVWERQYSRSPAGKMDVHFSPTRGKGMGEMVYDTIAESVSQARLVGHETLETAGERWSCAIVEVEYAGNKDRVKYTFWIMEQQGLVLRRVVDFWDGNEPKTRVASVRALTVNEELPASVFQFEPPPRTIEVPPAGGVEVQRGQKIARSGQTWVQFAQSGASRIAPHSTTMRRRQSN